MSDSDCYEEACEKEAIVECKKCNGEFCYEHYNKNHPKGVCIHY